MKFCHDEFTNPSIETPENLLLPLKSQSMKRIMHSFHTPLIFLPIKAVIANKSIKKQQLHFLHGSDMARVPNP